MNHPIEAGTMSVRDYLSSRSVPFEMMLHSPAPCSTRLAHSLHVPGERVAKSVLLSAAGGYLLAVLPATHRVDLDRLAEQLGVSDVRLATEDEVERVFNDCERGALPPFGRLYGLTTVIDASLAGDSELIFEGNMRHEGVRMRVKDFESLEAPVRAPFATSRSAPPRPRLAAG